jgi:hypothetical protein
MRIPDTRQTNQADVNTGVKLSATSGAEQVMNVRSYGSVHCQVKIHKEGEFKNTGSTVVPQVSSTVAQHKHVCRIQISTDSRQPGTATYSLPDSQCPLL